MKQIAAALAVALLGCAHAKTTAAQPPLFGEIHVFVVDEKGGPLAGVTVSVRNGEPPEVGDQVQMTPASGRVILKDEGQGDYYLRCQLSGFVSQTLGPLRVGFRNPALLEVRVVMTVGNVWYYRGDGTGLTAQRFVITM